VALATPGPVQVRPCLYDANELKIMLEKEFDMKDLGAIRRLMGSTFTLDKSDKIMTLSFKNKIKITTLSQQSYVA
jgi:ArsR family metal-binding transcriptional regulator